MKNPLFATNHKEKRLTERERDKQLFGKEPKILGEWSKDVVDFMNGQVLKMIDELEIDYVEKQLNKKTFAKCISELKTVDERMNYICEYIGMMYLEQIDVKNKRKRNKNDRIIKRIARRFENITDFHMFDFH